MIGLSPHPRGGGKEPQEPAFRPRPPPCSRFPNAIPSCSLCPDRSPRGDGRTPRGSHAALRSPSVISVSRYHRNICRTHFTQQSKEKKNATHGLAGQQRRTFRRAGPLLLNSRANEVIPRLERLPPDAPAGNPPGVGGLVRGAGALEPRIPRGACRTVPVCSGAAKQKKAG